MRQSWWATAIAGMGMIFLGYCAFDYFLRFDRGLAEPIWMPVLFIAFYRIGGPWFVLLGCVALGATAVYIAIFMELPIQWHSRHEVVPSVPARPTFVGAFLAIAGLAICWAPIVGLAVAMCAFAANRKTVRWSRNFSIAAVVLSSASTLLVAVAVLRDCIY